LESRVLTDFPERTERPEKLDNQAKTLLHLTSRLHAFETAPLDPQGLLDLQETKDLRATQESKESPELPENPDQRAIKESKDRPDHPDCQDDPETRDNQANTFRESLHQARQDAPERWDHQGHQDSPDQKASKEKPAPKALRVIKEIQDHSESQELPAQSALKDRVALKEAANTAPSLELRPDISRIERRVFSFVVECSILFTMFLPKHEYPHANCHQPSFPFPRIEVGHFIR